MSVTDRDRETAEELGGPHESWCNFVAHADCCHDGRDERFSCECGTWPRKQLIAAALAEEREKARAPFLALADEMHDSAKVARDAGDPYWVPLSSIEHFADRIRRAAKVTE